MVIWDVEYPLPRKDTEDRGDNAEAADLNETIHEPVDPKDSFGD